MSGLASLQRFAAGTILIATAPLSALSAAAITVFDGRPVLFHQPRLGLHRKPFGLHKLRTMRDGRVTPIGRVLRDRGWDEIPQLWSVWTGDMSLIGPRPLTREDADRLALDHWELGQRYDVPPGLTGLVQVLGTRGAAFSVQVENGYARRRCATLDAHILMLSGCSLLLGKDRTRDMVAKFPRYKDWLLGMER
jgi:lipopolysaccharide/colanic/teichoic acid biosynthesis glycosyltransferase